MSDALLDLLAETLTIVQSRLNPSAVESKASELLRGSLPADTSPRVGGRSSRRGDPRLDEDDRTFRKGLKQYRKHINDMAKSARLAMIVQGGFLNVPEPLLDPECANPSCKEPVKDRRSGECGRCRTHRSRYGRQWPAKISEIPQVNA